MCWPVPLRKDHCESAKAQNVCWVRSGKNRGGMGMGRKEEGTFMRSASFNEVMYTSIVEYSLIGAAVMFIVWRNIGKVVHSPMSKM